MAKAYDNPIPGYGTATVGNLRLWEALPVTELDLDKFNEGKFAEVCSCMLSLSPAPAFCFPALLFSFYHAVLLLSGGALAPQRQAPFSSCAAITGSFLPFAARQHLLISCEMIGCIDPQ